MSCETLSCPPTKRRRIPGPAGEPYLNLNNAKQTQDLAEQKEEEKQEEDGIPNYMSLSGRITSDRIELSSPELWKGPWLCGCIDNNIKIICENNKLYLLRNNNSFLFSSNLQTIIFGENRISHVFKVKELMVLIKSLTIYSDGIGEVIDCFGSMKATFTHDVLKNFNDIRAGSCLILENITVYQSSHYDFYLNITENNIFKIYNKNTKIPIHLKNILKQFHKNLGIKHVNKKKIKSKIVNKQINVNKNILNKNETPLKMNKKRRYSDIADSPWLISKTNINKTKGSEFQQKIMDIDISDSDEDKPIMSAQNKSISKDNIENDKEDSEDVIILPNKHNEKEENNEESDDDIIIKDMDMNETPGRIKEMPLGDKDMNKGNMNKKNKPKYKRKFSFKNRKKQLNKSDDKSKSKSPSIWSKHYENRNNNNMNDKSVSMFNNVNENNEIPKGTNLMVDLFAGMEDGFCFPE